MQVSKAKDPRGDAIEQEFLAALDRLKAGKPKNKELLALSKEGKLRISVSTVSQEAGRSRTLIGHAQCQYPHVRDKILAMRHGEGEPTRLQDVLSNKRQETAKLKRELQNLASHCAALIVRAAQLQERNEELERQVKRMAAQR
jgi:hypothetical protein